MKTLEVEIPSSKSILIRLLMIESFSPGPLIFYGQNSCDDVNLCRKALENFFNGKTELDCGASAALLRFLAFRISRQQGEFKLRGSRRLMARGHAELLRVLNLLGVETKLEEEALILSSKGWVIPANPLEVSADSSSQILSGLLLSSWGLEKSLILTIPERVVSRTYLFMTLELMRFFQFPLEKLNEKKVRIPARTLPIQKLPLVAEQDMSSAFSVAAFGVLNGSVKLKDFPHRSLQGDFVFPALLSKMGVSFEREGEDLLVKGPVQKLTSIEADLEDTPDLFPVLATLALFAKGRSTFKGLSHLRLKESDRIEKVKELAEFAGASVTIEGDGYSVLAPEKMSSTSSIAYDCENDHRLAMAASLLMSQGMKINLKGSDCVSKSYPGFWEVIGLDPGVAR
ncbi:hypothetical protein GW915_09090 [bacterium]|nr:hypothetical protein [bacterium]